MAKISVYYDYFEDGIKPITMVIRFKPSEDPWRLPHLYVPLQAPFRRFVSSDFADGILSAAITLDLLTVNPDRPQTFGIDMRSLKSRVYSSDEPVEQFLIRICDIEDVLQMEVNRNYAWEATT